MNIKTKDKKLTSETIDPTMRQKNKFKRRKEEIRRRENQEIEFYIKRRICLPISKDEVLKLNWNVREKR